MERIRPYVLIHALNMHVAHHLINLIFNIPNETEMQGFITPKFSLLG